MSSRLRITYVKSAIGYERRQKATIRALGFKRLGQTVEHDDSPVIRGMINKVQHLVAVEPAEG
jgi:large subunit ribosomal protein L30